MRNYSLSLFSRSWAIALLVAILQLIGAIQSSHFLPMVAWDLLIFLGLSYLWWRYGICRNLVIGWIAVILFLLADPGTGWGPVMWGTLIPMFFLIRTIPNRLALFGYGQWIGSMIAAGSFSWLWVGVQNFFNASSPFGFLLFVIAVLLMGLQFSLFFLLTGLLFKKISLPVGLVGAFVYTLVEFWIPLFFPMQLGLSFCWFPVLIQIADLAGITGISLSIALVSGLLFTLYEAWCDKNRRNLLVWGLALWVLIAFQIMYGLVCLHVYRPSPDSKSIDVAMIQPVSPLKIDNADRETKEGGARNLIKLSKQAVTGSSGLPDLLIWPEGAAAFSYRKPDFNPEYSRALKEFLNEIPIPIILQDVEFVRIAGSSKIRYFSTITLVDRDEKVLGGYRKRILLPFAEYLPGEERFPFIRKYFYQTRSILKGDRENLLDGPGGPFVPLICYELVFGNFVREFVKQENRAKYIVNLTNDRWYGPRLQPKQHLGFAVFRAVENRLPVIRSTNSGISALVDSRGVIQPDYRTEIMEQTVLRGLLYPNQHGGLTLYTKFGDFIPRWILTPLFLLGCIYAVGLSRLNPYKEEIR